MEIIKALKAEQKVLEKKLQAIQVSLKAAFDAFHKEQRRGVSATKHGKRARSKRRGPKVSRKRPTRKAVGRVSTRRAA
jgi:hypothetical protein